MSRRTVISAISLTLLCPFIPALATDNGNAAEVSAADTSQFVTALRGVEIVGVKHGLSRQTDLVSTINAIQIDRENVQNVVCVVTRYFGGILLGAGGLTRAYTKTAKMALDAAGIARRCVWDCVDISCSYAFLERARLELAAQSGEELNAEYGAAVLLHACLPQEKTAALAARLQELSAGTVTPVKTGNIYRAERVEK